MQTVSSFKHILWVALLAITAPIAQATPLTQVSVAQGKLIGSDEGNLTVFKGVPFAKPPVGELRWKAPQPAEKWQGVRDAKEFAPAPIQAGNPPSGSSEDSLYLNIWTPAKSSAEKLPVFVWIYGGGFSFGSSSDAIFDGTQLANKGVIVVSIAYRVGQLGFLAHPELNKESKAGVSGNYGLLDQIAALKWLNNNITAFGGDANNITIAGESAGGISVSMLAASPLTKGLINKVISQSGGSFGPTRKNNYPGENMSTLQQAQVEGLDYVKQFGASSIAELRNMKAETFIPKGWSLPGGWPIVDDYVIKGDQYKLYQQGKFNDVPALIGYNSDEGLSFVWDPDVDKFVTGVKERFGPFAENLLDAYPVANKHIPRSARNLVRDAAFGWHTWSWAKLQTQHGKAPVYLYYFDHHPTRKAGAKDEDHGAAHGHEIAYMFKNLNKADPNLTKADVQMAEAMATYWTNFAKNGNPNDDTLPNWPAFNNNKPSTMYFQQQPKVGPVPDKKALETLDRYFQWRRTPEGKKWANQTN
ncbi:carboxylesterase/lipase family protein [Pseudoalteromonas mariniglutinosa]|uniref:carboxylesterase/lipase family protein n=1 Tax=Pseudoalteromonas mariniglutinosa TaxID=206042 RepID=UPI00384CC746